MKEQKPQNGRTSALCGAAAGTHQDTRPGPCLSLTLACPPCGHLGSLSGPVSSTWPSATVKTRKDREPVGEQEGQWPRTQPSTSCTLLTHQFIYCSETLSTATTDTTTVPILLMQKQGHRRSQVYLAAVTLETQVPAVARTQD